MSVMWKCVEAINVSPIETHVSCQHAKRQIHHFRLNLLMWHTIIKPKLSVFKNRFENGVLTCDVVIKTVNFA